MLKDSASFFFIILLTSVDPPHAATSWGMPIPESQRVSFPLGWEVVIEASEPPTSDMSKPLVHNIMYYRPEEVDAEAFVVSVIHVFLFYS